ncbi:MFS-type transporter SLC18B1-like [Neocloeon triangulifer]|uniref:MFS-type transporter SLC18B1-like n=1 Tax=Neocloeon triangulifer TaxID=2078957 RepID=UPI00286F1B28|nr:MFS-type transporter SLC18B1-like [Neocloeon triangulifer]XP_059473906.1 MFS-type transporter SLC18B1-like [Neocloeon triangulifer]
MSVLMAAEKFTCHQWRVLAMLASLHLVRAMSKSMQAPLYPPEAASKGVSPAGSGAVFSIYELTIFIICPFLSKIINKTGYTMSIHLGMLLTGMSYISIGLLDLSESPDTFLYVSVLTRVVDAVGTAIVYMSVFAIVLVTFPNSVAFTYAILEFFYGLGCLIGPIAGALLLQNENFMVPFVSVGGLMLVISYVAPCVFPSNLPSTAAFCRETDKMNISSVLSSLKITAIQVNMVCIAVTTSVYSFYAPVLQPHLLKFELSPLEISITFVLMFGTAMVMMPGACLLCDAGVPGLLLTSVGLAFIFTGSLFIGPVPFLSVKNIWPLCAAGLVVAGLGMAFVLGGCFVDGISALIQHGYDDDLETFGLMTALFSASYCLGGFVGPFVSGTLYNSLGFRASIYFVLMSTLLAMAVIVAYVIVGAVGDSSTSAEQGKEVSFEDERKYCTDQCSQDCIYGSAQVFF